MIAIDFIKEQELAVDIKAIEQITFTGNLDRDKGATMFFTIEEAKEAILDFLHRTGSTVNLCYLNIISV